MKINTIYNEDSLEGLKKLPSKSIDCIITDPPYFCGMTHNGQRGEFSDLVLTKPFFQTVFSEFKRVLKDTGILYMFNDWRTYPFYAPLLMDYIPLKNLLVWDKCSGPGSHYAFFYELIIVAFSQDRILRGGNIVKIPGFSGGAKRTNGLMVHPTQKPVEIIEKLILDSTQPGDLILDAFMGSGTTAVAAIRTGRSYIGFEIQEKYIEVSGKRIAAEKASPKLFNEEEADIC